MENAKKMKDLREQGLSGQQIAERLRLPLGEVYETMIESGIEDAAALERRTLSDEAVAAVFEMNNKKLNYREIGAMLDIPRNCVSDIVCGRAYRDVAGKLGLLPRAKRKEKLKYRLAPMALAAREGFAIKDIAEIFGLNALYVGRMFNTHGVKANIIPYSKRRDLSLSEEDIVEIFRLRNEEKATLKRIAGKFGISSEFARRILAGIAYPSVSKKHGLEASPPKKRT